jgi:phosphoglycolate phosphatase-like HAD superfamily hydrolase
MLLLLMDVDGTLFLTDDPLVGEATAEAARVIWGIDLARNCLAEPLHDGGLALGQMHALARRAGVPESEIEGGLPRWCALHAELYLARLAETDTSAWHAAPAAAETLTELQTSARLALLTGNAEPIARARMERLGLARFFPEGQGAFGCEAEERARLIGIARERAGGWPAAETVAVGDTAADVAGAHAAGIRVVGVHGHPEALAGADARISSLSSLPEALSALRPSA